MAAVNARDVKILDPNPDSNLTQHDIDGLKKRGKTKSWPSTPFPINPNINKKVVIHTGDVGLLRADALVNPTNESLTQLDFVAQLAGLELETYIKRRIKQCATGDVRLTPGFRSGYSYIIHAVPPKYQPKYKTAAETALFHTYFRILETMIENKLRTVVMPTLSTSRCNLPFEDNFNMQLRIVRRILEKRSDDFDKIVVVFKPNQPYAIPFYCYFPRTKLDEELACYQLDSSIGGLNGEPVIQGREIRIKSRPTMASLDDRSVDLRSGLDLSTVVGKTAFSRMQDYSEQGKSPGSLNRWSSSKSSTSLDARKHPNNQVSCRKDVFQGCSLF